MHFYGIPGIVNTAPSSLDIGPPLGTLWGSPGDPGPKNRREHLDTSGDPAWTTQGTLEIPQEPAKDAQGPTQGPPGPPRVPRDTSSAARGPPSGDPQRPPGIPQAPPRYPQGPFQNSRDTPSHLQRSRGLCLQHSLSINSRTAQQPAAISHQPAASSYQPATSSQHPATHSQ